MSTIVGHSDWLKSSVAGVNKLIDLLRIDYDTRDREHPDNADFKDFYGSLNHLRGEMSSTQSWDVDKKEFGPVLRELRANVQPQLDFLEDVSLSLVDRWERSQSGGDRDSTPPEWWLAPHWVYAIRTSLVKFERAGRSAELGSSLLKELPFVRNFLGQPY